MYSLPTNRVSHIIKSMSAIGDHANHNMLCLYLSPLPTLPILHESPRGVTFGYIHVWVDMLRSLHGEIQFKHIHWTRMRMYFCIRSFNPKQSGDAIHENVNPTSNFSIAILTLTPIVIFQLLDDRRLIGRPQTNSAVQVYSHSRSGRNLSPTGQNWSKRI